MKTIQTPTTQEVAHARRAAGHTQAQAAKTVHLSSAHRWSEYEMGERQIAVPRWELYLLLTDQHPTLKVNVRKVVKHLPNLPDPQPAAEREAERGEVVA